MAKNEAKIKFTAETGEFNSQIQKANSTMQVLRAELKLNETQMKANGASVEALEEKHRILSNQFEAAKSKTEALSNKLEAAVRNFGEGSAEVDKWRTQLINAQTAQAKVEQAVAACSSELDDLTSDLRKNDDAMDKAADGAEELDRSIDKAADAAEDAGEGFTVFKGVLADLVSNGIQFVISGVGDLVGSFMGLSEETKEYRTIMASLDSSSELAGYTAEETASSFEQLNGVLGDSQASATTTANLQAIGLEQEKLESLTNGVIGAWAKYGDSIPIDGLGEAINHTAQLGEVQGTLADVLEWGGLSVEDFNEKLGKCSNETERADLIAKMLADQGLTKMGEAWQETNKDIVDANNAQADYEENTAKLAQQIAPVTTSLRDGFNSVVEKVLELTEDVDFEGFGQLIEDSFGTFIDDILPKIIEGVGSFIEGAKEAVTWMKEHQTVIGFVAAAVAVLTTAITAYNVVQGVKAAMEAANVTTVWALVSAHLAQAAAAIAAVAPYVLIVAAIAAVIAIIVVCIKHWDDIVAAVKRAWEIIKETLSGWGKWIDKNVVQPIVKFFKKLWTGIKNIFSGTKEWFREKFAAAKEAVLNAWSSVKNFFSNIWSGVKNTFANVKSWFSDKFTSAKNAVFNAWSNVVSKFTNLKDKIVNAFKNVKEKLSQPFVKARDAIRKVVDKIKGFFKFKFSWPKIPMPHFGITPSGWKIGDLLKGSIPKLGISWYKDGGIFTKPTIFGTASGFKGVGEAGAEAVLPIDRLEGYIAGAIEKTMNVVNLDKLAAAVEDLANRPVDVYIGDKRVAQAIAGASDSVNGLRTSFQNRGLVL